MFSTGNTLKSTTTVASAINGLTKVSSALDSTVTKAVNSALGAINTAAASTVTAVNSMAKNTTKALNTAVPSINSILPFSNTEKKTNIGKNALNSFKNGYNNFRNVTNSSINSANSEKSPWGMLFGLGLFLVAIFLIALFVFQEQINIAWNYLTISIHKMLKKDVPENETSDDKLKSDENNILTPLPLSIDSVASKESETGGLLNKIMPMGTKEVFNVSLNDYTYYDAEPLCLALGAELASYEQVKEAWNKGADWCNYGWTKGQLAIYPTQKETWEKLQHGPVDENGACGRPGVNGGYFDNPEMRFGVNCYGIKPDQSANDERILMENGTIPKTASTLKMNKQIEEIKENIDMVGILPFSSSKWSA